MKVARLLALLTLAVAGTVVALPASPAQAAPLTIREITKTVSANPGTHVRGDQSCTNTEALVSTAASGDKLTSVGPGTTNENMRAAGVVFPQAPIDYLFLQGACVPRAQLGVVTVETAIGAPASTPNRTATARCTDGKVAFGGGGVLLTPSGLTSLSGTRLVGSIPTADGTGWTATALTSSPTDRLYVRTYCALLPGSVLQPDVTFAPGPGPGFVAQGYNRCPAGLQPLTGGVYMRNGSGGDSLGGLLVHTNRVANGQIGWFGYAKNMSATDRLIVRVRCIA